MTRADRIAGFRRSLGERILLLDGAMGTRIQSHSPSEADDRGTCCRDWPGDLKGNKDLPTLTRPQLIADVHTRFLGVSADFVAAEVDRLAAALVQP